MVNWIDLVDSNSHDKLPNGMRCKAKDVCPRLARQGNCGKRWIALKPDKKCPYNVKPHQKYKKVKEFCKKSCEGKQNFLH